MRIWMTDTHIVKAPEVALEADKMHPMVVAAMRGGGLDTQSLRELMELQREWQRDNARAAYTRSIVQLKSKLPSVLEKDKPVKYPNKNSQGITSYRFTTLSYAMEIVTPYLNEYGFSLIWIPTTSDGMVRVTCRLTHIDGHYEETTMSAPPDSSGRKNPIQAIGSTQSYLERYTALALLGIATKDMPDADDPPVPSDDIIDTERNLNAIARLRKKGISVKDAEAHVRKPAKDWTIKELDMLWSWQQSLVTLRNTDTKAESADLLKQIYEMAERAWGDEWGDRIAVICDENGFRLDKATYEQKQYLIGKLRDLTPTV
jgi:hypothetical protein